MAEIPTNNDTADGAGIDADDQEKNAENMPLNEKNNILYVDVDERVDGQHNSINRPHTLGRMNTLQRLNTFHHDTVRRTDRVCRCECPEIGLYEVYMVLAVIFNLLCYATIVYGIYAGNELHIFWSQFSSNDINLQCNGQYHSAFTYRSKHGHTVDWDSRFVGMIVEGSIQIAGYFAVPAVLYWKSSKSEDEQVSIATYTAIGSFYLNAIWSIIWFVDFILCLKFYHRVMMYCDEGTPIYGGISDIFDWFYPIVIYEIVKGSVFCCSVCVCGGLLMWSK